MQFLQTIPQRLGMPRAIVVISAHWETPVVSVTAGAQPPLLYDYYGFPPNPIAPVSGPR
ncbi:MAG: hypothetical protein R3F38_13900 [Gammaproteobacteria bacterium]